MTDAPSDAADKTETPLVQYHLVLFQHPDANPISTPCTIIDQDLVWLIQTELDRVITTPPKQTAIDVWIDSPGGDAHAAYKLAIDLRHRAALLRAVIPDRAKSAATLLALGMDKILMAPAAELGPLDAQISHPDREDIIVSALDLTNSLDFLGRAALNLAISGGASVIQITGLPRLGALDAVLRFSAALFTPAMQKLDPHLIHQATSQLKVAEQYALTMLSTGRTDRGGGLINASNAQMLIKRLVEKYPAHGYVISRDEATTLGLEIEQAEHHPRWDKIKLNYHNYRKSGTHLIKAVADTVLDPPQLRDIHSKGEASKTAHTDAAAGNGVAREQGTSDPVQN